MKAKQLFFYFLFLTSLWINAQNNNPIALDEVVVADAVLNKYSNSLQIKNISDTLIEKNYNSLTNLLRYNSLLYFKENGNGMVSSVSFRGTTAAQTAVIWNGININSQLLGQTDFNTITPLGYSRVSVRSGGGSGIYGSSAIGGTVHLNNELKFNKQFTNRLSVNLGSFNTQGYFYDFKGGTDKLAVDISFSRNSSSNDYTYLNRNKVNQNGAYDNTSLNTNFGYKINSNHEINIYSQLYDGNREFSGTIVTTSNSKYKDLNSRNLLEWIANKDEFTSRLKLAYITESYKYFENKTNNNYTNGGASTKIIKYDLEYTPSIKLTINSVFSYTHINGFGSSIDPVTRQVGTAGVLLKYLFTKKLKLETSARQELTTNYKTPFLYSVGLVANPLHNYTVKLNASKNFRVPTFNDLFWVGSGNLNLKLESSQQVELGQELHLGAARLSATLFYIDTKDMIRWVPNESGIWMPINTDVVKNKGLEITGHFRKKIKKHLFDFDMAYAYTSAVDQIKQKKLIYVPYHKFTSTIDYSFANWSINYQLLFNGSVFITTDNSNKLKEYSVSNLSTFYKMDKNEHYKIGFQVLNLFNKDYQTVEIRPMPGINYNFSLTIKY
ncbi:TonB-dependent receptor [Flavobacterium sp. 7A]|uniref:TonB-dependent receptor n=1 Tax=Flavobacterium sp. 7A TaxID=2940571 RepID=UPI002227E88D|nr:TonB-dependent receptor [Flavobacterium sp. 7A]MCW2119589.1 iron complex outermembrane receptor protein [Flavobacterium sp. 7A]